MTDHDNNTKIAELIGFHNTVGLMKRGLWYRPNSCGYTDREEEAGRYALEEAKKHEYLLYEPVTIHKFSTPKFNESLDACALFEKTITGQNVGMYEHFLGEITQSDALALRRSFVGERMRLIRATPLQRCEAFLKVCEWAEKNPPAL